MYKRRAEVKNLMLSSCLVTVDLQNKETCWEIRSNGRKWFMMEIAKLIVLKYLLTVDFRGKIRLGINKFNYLEILALLCCFRSISSSLTRTTLIWILPKLLIFHTHKIKNLFDDTYMLMVDSLPLTLEAYLYVDRCWNLNQGLCHSHANVKI